MAENIQIELDHEEASVSVYILKNIAGVEGERGQLISSLHSAERIDAAKGVLRKIQIGQKQRINHIESTQPSQRNLSSATQADNTRLMDENLALKEQLKKLQKKLSDVGEALENDNFAYARGLFRLEKYSD